MSGSRAPRGAGPGLFGAALAVAWKDLTLLRRDRASLFFTLAFPVLVAILFGLVFGGVGKPRRLEVAIVDESKGPAAAALVLEIERDPVFDARRTSDREEGLTMVRRGAVSACIVIPPGFDRAADRFPFLGGLPLEAYTDPGRAVEAGLIEGKLSALASRHAMRGLSSPAHLRSMAADGQRMLEASPQLDPARRAAFESLFRSLSMLAESARGGVVGVADGGESGAAGASGAAGEASSRAADAPLMQGNAFAPVRLRIDRVQELRASPPSTFAITFPQGAVWGLAGCVMAFASAYAAERSRGTLARMHLAPVGRHAILLGKAMACLAAALVMQITLIALAWAAFGVRPVDPIALSVALVATSVAFTGIAMLIAAMFRSDDAAQGAGRALVLVMAIIGGGSIPLVFMPDMLRRFSGVSPFRWAVAAIEAPLWRGTPWVDQWPALLILIAIGAGCSLAAWLALSRRDRALA
jgi:ABC-2 type transport system permease protein